MRIGFFTDTYLPVSNGICYVIDIIKKDLKAAGHEIFIFAPRNIFAKLPPERRIIRYPALQGMLYEDQFTSFFWVPSQVKKVKAMKLDVIVLFTPSLVGSLGAHAAMKLGTPFIIQYGTDMEAYGESYKFTTIFGLIVTMLIGPYLVRLSAKQTLKFYKNILWRSDKKENYYRYATRLMMSLLHERAAKIVATSEKTAAQLRTWPIEQDVVSIPTGVDALPSSKQAARRFSKKYGLNSDDQIILYAGRLSVEKNLDRLIDAFALVAKKNPKAKLLLVGDFQHRQHLEAQAADSGYAERIIFTGLIKREVLGSVYRLAQVFAFPSLTDCQALVLNEAAHAGLPLVWCDTPDLNPVLVDGTSGLRAECEKEDLANKLIKLLSDEKLRRSCGRQAKQLAKKYSETRQSKKIERLLKEIVDKSI